MIQGRSGHAGLTMEIPVVFFVAGRVLDHHDFCDRNPARAAAGGKATYFGRPELRPEAPIWGGMRSAAK